MSQVTLSVLGMYRQDETILNSSNFILPEEVDRPTLVNMILGESAELETLYPDPIYFKVACKAWSTARCPSWVKMFDVLAEEYSPLYNYDRTETESGTNTGTDQVTETERIDDTTTESATDSVTDHSTDGIRTSTAENITDTSTGTNSNTTTGQVTGFNSSTFADNNKAIASGSSSDSSVRDREQGETTDRTTDRESTTGRERETAYGRGREAGKIGSSSGSHSRNLRAFGNIGVTTTQAMLLEELEARKQDIYRIIVDEFIYYFCLRVY